MLPAVGQGALGLECRAGDRATRAILGTLDDPPTRAAVEAERALLFHLGGGCQVPLAAVARVDGDRLILRGVVLSADGARRIASEESGFATAAAAVGARLADRLRYRGAADLLAAAAG
jgi:hydroxymethylbilane synthase